jgi:DNA-binding Lrp family transcriptional regulator
LSKEEEKLKLLFELIKGARRSDRELAKVIGTSQPTVTRKRTLLEKEGYIKEYTALPDLRKMGYEILAFTFLSFADTIADKPDMIKKAREWSQSEACVIFASDGEGLGMNSVLLSVHRNYADFSRLITRLRTDWRHNCKDIRSFIISIDRPELMVKHFSLQYLESYRK